jgi:predicted RNase H-like nuclease (RuvC/YqgF family)
MKQDYSALQSEIHTNKKPVFKLKEDVDVSVNALESELNYISAKIYKNKAIADEQIEKLQKELQEFKKATNEFQRHLTGVSIILSVAVVFILILISFYTKL